MRNNNIISSTWEKKRRELARSMTEIVKLSGWRDWIGLDFSLSLQYTT